MSVAVVIPVYNRANVVGRAIDSVLAQEGFDQDSLSIIVVDDGSSDELDAMLEAYRGRIQLVRHPRNAGAAAARNTGVAAAASDYVAFLDTDDIWLPSKLSVQLAAMREHGWQASCTGFWLHRSRRSAIMSPDYPTGPLGLDDLVWGCFVSPGSTLVIERRLFTDVGPLDTALQRLEDLDWLLRYCARHPLGFIATPLANVTASSFSDAGKALAAIEVLRARHMPTLSAPNRRRFAASLDFEKAAALSRGGARWAALRSLAASLLRHPFRHKALAAVLHNRKTG